MRSAILLLGGSLVLAACGQEAEPDEPMAESAAVETTAMNGGDAARADVRDAQGSSLGVVELEDADFGVTLSGTLPGLSPGEHGFHDPGGPHAGDLRNLVVAEDGSALVDGADSLVTLRGGASALLDGDGSALVVHADPDDYRSQPSGNSGDRVACGVIEG